MSVRLELTWSNVPALNNYISINIPNATREAEVAGMDRGASKARDVAKGLCPVDTGALRQSIRKEKHSWPAANVLYVGIRAGGYIINPKTGRLVDYASFVEYGTSKMAAQPFIRPALNLVKTLIPIFIMEEMNRRVRRT